MDQRLPAPLSAKDAAGNPGAFVEERARQYLKQLTSVGPRPAGKICVLESILCQGDSDFFWLVWVDLSTTCSGQLVLGLMAECSEELGKLMAVQIFQINIYFHTGRLSSL